MEIASHLANVVVYSVVELHNSGSRGSPGISNQGISRSGTSGNKLDKTVFKQLALVFTQHL